jgi:hypothetical protein
LKPLPISNRIWQNILIDFITNFPLSLFKEKVYNSILVVINRYSKIIQFIPYNKNMDAPKLTEIIKNQNFKYFNLFSLYIIDRKTLFISN